MSIDPNVAGLVAAQKIVDDFNEVNPVGTVVRYWRGFREDAASGEGPTWWPAYLNINGVPVVHITGCSGYIALTHVEAVSS